MALNFVPLGALLEIGIKVIKGSMESFVVFQFYTGEKLRLKKKVILVAGVFLLLSLFVANTHGDECSGVILQPVQKPAAGQSYAGLKAVELWLVHSPDSIYNRKVKAVIDGKEIALRLKNARAKWLKQT